MISSVFWRFTLLATLALSGCGGSDGESALPGGGLYAKVAVGDQTFHASITHPDGEAQARALWAGTSSASIPSGDLICSGRAWNEPWNWHLAPESVRFADTTIELCDGEPSYVAANCPTFAEGRYCPWGAELVELRDCSADPACPLVPR
jgi:hypothetical protein